MLGIQQKLLLGFGGLLAIVIGIGALTIRQIDDLGDAIDIILRENYRSVIACQEMKEAMERIDSGLLFSLLGEKRESAALIDKGKRHFIKALETEQNNITIPGEGEKTHRVTIAFQRYREAIPRVTEESLSPPERRTAYFSVLLPMFMEIKTLAQEILEMNQHNMLEANSAARDQAAAAHQRMFWAIWGCLLIAVIYSLWINRWILRPIRHLIGATREICGGNLDLVVSNHSRDEIGQLSHAFNTMAESLRNTRRQEQIQLARSHQTTSQLFKVLPTIVAVLDLEGRIEVSTESAQRYFELKPGGSINDHPLAFLPQLVKQSRLDNKAVHYDGQDGCFQYFVDGKEHFYQPVAIPIYASGTLQQTGSMILLNDLTQFLEQRELKRGVVATVSHQLKTPLTAMRMSIHLLLDDRLGPLNPQQTELLLAAREESERLAEIVHELLEINRMESGAALLERQSMAPIFLARESAAPFLTTAKDRGITLRLSVPENLPAVWADPTRIKHLFANLLDNALRFTPAGGEIELNATRQAEQVRFTVRDSGPGIPEPWQRRIFDPFFRVPDQAARSGAGLGLTIVREIATAHEGKIGVESVPGHGATFWFTLPCSDEPSTDSMESS